MFTWVAVFLLMIFGMVLIFLFSGLLWQFSWGKRIWERCLTPFLTEDGKIIRTAVEHWCLTRGIDDHDGLYNRPVRTLAREYIEHAGFIDGMVLNAMLHRLTRTAERLQRERASRETRKQCVEKAAQSILGGN